MSLIQISAPLLFALTRRNIIKKEWNLPKSALKTILNNLGLTEMIVLHMDWDVCCAGLFGQKFVQLDDMCLFDDPELLEIFTKALGRPKTLSDLFSKYFFFELTTRGPSPNAANWNSELCKMNFSMLENMPNYFHKNSNF